MSDPIPEVLPVEPAGRRTGLRLQLTFSPFGWMLLFCTPRVVIDDHVYKRPWGLHFFPLEPGEHAVEVYFPYLFQSRAGASERDIVVRPGEVTQLRYHMPPLIFVAGSLERVSRHARLSDSSGKGLAWVFLLLTAAPFVLGALCCGGLGLVDLYQQADRAREEAAWQEKLAGEEDQRRRQDLALRQGAEGRRLELERQRAEADQKLRERLEAAQKKRTAEEAVRQQQREEKQLQFELSKARTGAYAAASSFRAHLLGRKLDDAHALTSQAFREKTPRAAFAAFVQSGPDLKWYLGTPETRVTRRGLNDYTAEVVFQPQPFSRNAGDAPTQAWVLRLATEAGAWKVDASEFRDKK